MRYEVRTVDEAWRMQRRIMARATSDDGTKRFLTDMVWEASPSGGYMPDSRAVTLDADEAMALLSAFAQEAWALGWRPEGYQADSSAKDRHLADMRAITFAKLNVEAP